MLDDNEILLLILMIKDNLDTNSFSPELKKQYQDLYIKLRNLHFS